MKLNKSHNTKGLMHLETKIKRLITHKALNYS